MIVTAKRLGWNERLTPEQEYDLVPYGEDEGYSSDDLKGEPQEIIVPAAKEHREIRMVLVGGQEADPATVTPEEREG